jgi:cell division protein FtsZ
VAHPDANIIFGAVIDDSLGEECRVTVIAAGFDKLGGAAAGRMARPAVSEFDEEEEEVPVPSLLSEPGDEEELFQPAPSTIKIDADDDLDIPDFLKR